MSDDLFGKPEKRKTKMDVRADDLIAFAFHRPLGFSYPEAMEEVGCKFRADFYAVVRRARQLLAEDGSTLICEPQGRGQPWRYFLTSVWAEARPGVDNRVLDLESRLQTMVNQLTPLVSHADGRTTDGKVAGMFLRGFAFMLDNARDIRSLDGHLK